MRTRRIIGAIILFLFGLFLVSRVQAAQSDPVATPEGEPKDQPCWLIAWGPKAVRSGVPTTFAFTWRELEHGQEVTVYKTETFYFPFAGMTMPVPGWGESKNAGMVCPVIFTAFWVFPEFLPEPTAPPRRWPPRH